MLYELPGAPFIALAIALLPALLRWWWGRPLAQMADDPLLPERLLANNTRVSATAAFCGALQFVAWPYWASWLLLLQMAASTAAAYPLRKTLYAETWSLAAFLGFFTRLLLGVFGFWLAIFATPWIVSSATPYQWPAAAAMATLLMAWSWYGAEVLRAALRTKPLPEGDLLERFRAVALRSRAPMPRFEVVDMRGGVLANALALASLRGSSVLFTDTLLSRLTADESTAICGHEIAHLEYYDTKRLRRLKALNTVLIVAACAIAPLMHRIKDATLPMLLFPAAVIVGLAIRARQRQKNETASDLRAVELTGDPDALVSALTTLHAIARIPRRWDQRREQQATHPSLARRLRDIRAAAGVSAAELAVEKSFNDASGPGMVTFEPARLKWQEGFGAVHLLEYSALAELRLHASATGNIRLVAIERHGRRWELTPAAGDVAALQSVLDTVDARLRDEVKPAVVFSAMVTRLLAATCTVLVLASIQFGAALVALLATIGAGPALLNAAGTAAIVAAAMILRDGAGGPGSTGIAILVASVGFALLALGWTRRAVTTRSDLRLVPVLAAFAALAIVAMVVDGLNPIRLHQSARAIPAATVLFVALATACWPRRDRALFRGIAVASVLVAAMTTAAGSTIFLDVVGRDPLLVNGPRPTEMTVGEARSVSVDLPFGIEALRLSPKGTLIAATRDEDDEQQDHDSTPGIYVGRTSARLSRIEADDLAFVDETRALVLVTDDASAEVRTLTFDGTTPTTVARERVDRIRSGTLSYDPRRNVWTLLGRDSQNHVVRAEGAVGRAGVVIRSWPGVTARGSWIEAVATHEATAVVIEHHYEFGMAKRLPLLAMVPGLSRSYSEMRLARVEGSNRTETGLSRLDTNCSVALPEQRIVCSAFDGTRTHLAGIDPATASVTPLATLDGRFWAADTIDGGWISGWWESGPAAIRLATHDVIRPPRVGDEFASLVAATDDLLAVVSSIDEGSRIRFYPVHGPTQTARRGE